MYRLVIADDDEIQLQGMCCAFPWEDLGIEVVAGVDDGDKALFEVVEKKADILLTDIKMSNMDGLELTEKIREQCPDTRVVIMSAYDDFQFAQKALRLGVDDYLLKPVDLEQMRETMRQIVYQKDEKKRVEQIQRRSRLEEMVVEDEEILEETFFQNVLNQKYARNICRKLEEPYRQTAQQKWFIIEALFDDSKGQEEKRSILQRSSRARGYKYIYNLGHHLFCCLGKEETAGDEVLLFEEECRTQIKSLDSSASISFIAGPYVSELYYLSLSYEKVRQICSYQFSEGKDRNLSEKDLDKYFDQNHTVNKSLVEYLAKLVEMGYTDMLPEYTERLKNNLRYTGSESLLMLSFSLSSILGELRRIPQLKEMPGDELDEIYYKIIKQKTLDEAMELLENELRRLSELVKETDCMTVEQSVQKACEYIEEHFTEPELRIGKAALFVGLSQNYFSTVFTEVTGESFTDYLIKRRMKEAQMLLMNPDYKIQEIGYMVGYDNPAYFSAAFKKFTGVSVSQYRKMIKGISL